MTWYARADDTSFTSSSVSMFDWYLACSPGPIFKKCFLFYYARFNRHKINDWNFPWCSMNSQKLIHQIFKFVAGDIRIQQLVDDSKALSSPQNCANALIPRLISVESQNKKLNSLFNEVIFGLIIFGNLFRWKITTQRAQNPKKSNSDKKELSDYIFLTIYIG